MVQALVIACALLSSFYVHALPDPELRIYNGTNGEILIGIYHKGWKHGIHDDVKPLHYLNVTDARIVKAVTAPHGGILALKDLDTNQQYQTLLQTAQEQKKDLCVTIKKVNPIEVSEITLCEKSYLFIPKVFIKNSNLLWGTLRDIKVSGPLPGNRELQTIEFLKSKAASNELQTI